jgi:hypothetical protein
MDAMSGITLAGTAAAGSATTITLTGGVATDNYYNGQVVQIDSGTGVGQARTILSYVGSTTVATVTRDWAVAPDGTSVYSVHSSDVPAILEAGTAQAGAAGSITLDAGASAINATYTNNFVMITGGTGIGQTRLIGTYTGATKVATVTPDWTTNPDATSVYQVLPMARVDVAGWLGNLVTGDGDWAQLQSDATAIVADTNELQTDDVPGLIAALNDLSAAAVNAEVDTALTDIGLDHLVSAAVIGADVTDNSIIAKLVSSAATADWDTFVNTTDALQALRDTLALEATVAALNDLSAAEVNTEVSDVLKVDTLTEPSQAIPPTTGVATMEDALRYLYFALTNRVDSDAVANFLEFYNRAAGAVQWKKPISDAASIATEGTGEAGP